MTQINLSKLIFYSRFSGLENSSQATLSYNVPSEVVGLSPTILTASIPISNANSISQVEFQLTGLDPNWYIFKGYHENLYTSTNAWTNNIVNASYGVDLDTAYTNTDFVVTISLYNYSLNNTYTTPAFTLNCNISLYVAPF